jgi:hypothetical protein
MKAAVSDLMLPILPGLHGEKTVCEYRITPSAKAYFYEIKSAPSCRILFSLSKEFFYTTGFSQKWAEGLTGEFIYKKYSKGIRKYRII